MVGPVIPARLANALRMVRRTDQLPAPATPATFGNPPRQAAVFAVEATYDGQRGLAVVSEDGVRLRSRNGANITQTFPKITAGLA